MLSSPSTPRPASQPTTVLNEPCTLSKNAESPMPMFAEPSSLLPSESLPMAWFCTPVVLLPSAPTKKDAPTALLESPSVLLLSAEAPTAVLLLPKALPVESLFCSASSPTAVFAAALIFWSSEGRRGGEG